MLMSNASRKIAVLSTVFLWCCKPTPAPPRSQQRADSSSIGTAAPAAIVASSSTAEENRSSSGLVTSPSTDTKQVMDTSIHAPSLQCAPKVFSRRDTITMRMHVPHGEYLVVIQPNGTWFYLVYPKIGERPDYSLLPSETFKGMPTIRFRADVRGKPLVYGRDTLEAVFHEPGKYVLESAANIEGERGSQIWKCTVQFVPQK